MSSTLAEPSVVSLLGDQRPRVWSAPPSAWSEGGRVADLSARAGLVLDDWQQWVLDQGLGRREDRRWAAFEVALIVSRQNGKGSILEALELAALFLDDFGVDLILHSAHEFKTAAEAFLRIQSLISAHPVFERRVERIRTSNGSEAIELRNGKRLRFIARSKGSGRGFSADLVILDEAYNLGDDEMSALLPTLSTRPNPQVWYTSTAGTETSVQLGRVRKRGLTGTDRSLTFMEWSVDDSQPYDPADPACWVQANPGLNAAGHGISSEYVERERATLAPDAFARERLGVGQYPTDMAEAWLVIPRDSWLGLAAKPVAHGQVALAGVVSRRRTWGTITAAWRRPDGRMDVEVVERHDGTAWLPGRLADLARKHRPAATVMDAGGPEGSLIDAVEALGVEVTKPTVREVAQGCGRFYDMAMDSKSLRHASVPDLNTAVAGACKRDLAEAWAWDAASPATDISPLRGVTLAAWAHDKFATRQAPYEMLRSVG